MSQMGQSWTASFGVWSAMMGTWQSVLKNRGVPAAQVVMDQITSPGSWGDGLASLVEELQEILALPRFSDIPELDVSAMPSLAPAVELMSVAQQFVLAAAPVWARICQRFQAEVVERRAGNAQGLDSAGDAMDIWNNIVDQTMMEFNRSSEFAGLQRRFLQAAMRQRREVRKVGERMARTADLPTRTEMDDVYRRLHDLHREVHGLQAEIRALKRGAAPRSGVPVGATEEIG
jgi:hypothetical protein